MYRKLNSVHLTQFSGKFFSLCLFELGDTSHRFRTQDIATPVTADLKRQKEAVTASYLIVSVIVIGPDSFHQLSQSAGYLRVHLCEGDSGAGLPVD
uniref:Uncharacterized protein n=1 Tax=Gorilla gorilla gorilla TaxID=9595 RepID=A0A2I2YKC3_GORGO